MPYVVLKQNALLSVRLATKFRFGADGGGCLHFETW